MSSGFYDIADAYEELSRRIEWLTNEWYRLHREREFAQTCGCWDDYWDRADHIAHMQVCTENETREIDLEIEYIGSMIDELKEIQKTVLESRERRKLAVLAWIMKRRK